MKNTDLSIYDPFAMKDMDRAAERVLRAIRSGENVAVLGDYDADGVSATAVLYLYLESANAGYGKGMVPVSRRAKVP